MARLSPTPAARRSFWLPLVLSLEVTLALLAAGLPRAAEAVQHERDPYAVANPELAAPTRTWVDPAGTPRPLHAVHSIGLSHPSATADPVRASLETVRAHPGLTAVAPENLELLSAREGAGIHFVHFRQRVDGLPVLDSRVSLLWDADGRLRLSHADVFVTPTGAELTRPAAPAWILEREARRSAVSGMPGDVAVTEWEHAAQAWLAVRKGDDGSRQSSMDRGDAAASDPSSTSGPSSTSDPSGNSGHTNPDGDRANELVPVWNIRFRTTAPPAWYDAVVHGETGRLLSRVNRLHFETAEGTITGQIEPITVGDQQELLGLPDLLLRFESTTDEILVHTNASGNFTTDLPAGLYDATTALEGRYAYVQDASAGLQVPSFTQPFTPPGRFDFEWNDGNATESTRDAYYHANVAHAAIRAIDDGTGMDPLDQPMRIDVDDPSGVCNAYWDGSRMNFYADGGGCVATARIADVVYHEYGHAVTEFAYSPQFAPFDIHEGASDYFAATIRNDPRIGAGFRGAGTFLRSIEPDAVYPDDVDDDPHVTGLIIAGAFWDLRKELGRETTDRLFHFARYAAPMTFDDYMLAVLVVDDDDADLSNGTPHFDDIVRAFQLHGIGNFDISILASPIPDIEDPGDTIEATVKIWSLFRLAPSELALFVAPGPEAEFHPIALEPTGEPGEYRARIPAPPMGTVVRYYWSAADTTGRSAVLPENAPAETFSFFVGADVVPPVIVADVPPAFAPDMTQFYFRATVSDNSQRIGEVRAEYRVDGGETQLLPLTPREAGVVQTVYEGTLDLGALSIGQEVFFRIAADDQAGNANTGLFPASAEARVPVRSGTALDFESGPGVVVLTGNWEWGQPQDAAYVFSGTHVLDTKLDANYDDDTVSDATWGPFDLTTWDRGLLQIRHRYETESRYDGGNVQISASGGSRWTVLLPAGGYPHPNISSMGEPGYSGASDGWELATFPLDEYLGQTVLLRFRFASDVGVRDAGWTIDDVLLVQAQARADARDFKGSEGEDRRVTLTWRAPAGVDTGSPRFLGYDLYRASGHDPFGETPLATGLRVTNYADTGVTNGTTYRYLLICVYDDGQSVGVETVGTPYAAAIGLSVTSLGATLRDYESTAASVTVQNLGAGTLDYNVFVMDATNEEPELSSVLLPYTVVADGPYETVVLGEDSDDSAAVVDLSRLEARQWDDGGNRMLEFTVRGYAPWGSSIRDWGGVLFIDTDGNLATSQGDFELGWGEGVNQGYEWLVVFGSLAPITGRPGVAILVDAERSTLVTLTEVEFPLNGQHLSFSVPLTAIEDPDEVRVSLVAATAPFQPAIDLLPDLPAAAAWLSRVPKHGQSVGGSQQRVDVTFANDDLPNGTYEAQLVFESNDQANPLLSLPVVLQVDRGIPTELKSVRITATFDGMQIAVLPSPALPPTAVRGERRVEGSEAWSELPPMDLGPDGYYRTVDRNVAHEQVYHYRFPLDFPEGQQTYGPFQRVYEPEIPVLVEQTSESRLASVKLTFQLAPELAGATVHVDRRLAEVEEWTRLTTEPLATDTSLTFTYIDRDVVDGQDYQYQFPISLETGFEFVYGPFDVRFESAFPVELEAVSLGSNVSGILVEFTVPEDVELLEGIFLDRRATAEEEWSQLHEDTLVPDESGHVAYLDRWSAPGAGVRPQAEYEYRVRLIAEEGAARDYMLTPVQFLPPIPLEAAFLPGQPSPFSDQVLFRFDLPSIAKVSIELFDATGRRVRSLVNAELPAGAHERLWDGRSDPGEAAPSGIYFARFRGAGIEKVQRIIRIR